MRGLGGVYLRGKIWWIHYSYRGKSFRESSGSQIRTDAIRLLKRRLSEIGRGRLVGPNIERTTLNDLAAMIETDYIINHRRVGRLKQSLAHLKIFFGHAFALDITPDRISEFIEARLAEGAANATINRDLAALHRAFRLGEKVGKVDRVPIVSKLAEHNVRKGFFEVDNFRLHVSYMPEDLQPLCHTAYITGWRILSELCTRRWPHVSFTEGMLRLEPGEAKNKEGRTFPLTSELREILEQQRARTDALERATGRIIPWVFHRKGKPIRDYRKAWATACEQSGLVGRIPHDFRRTAVRNLERAGVPRSASMAMVGHKTESIYKRYAITDEVVLHEGAKKLSALHRKDAAAARQKKARRVVVPF